MGGTQSKWDETFKQNEWDEAHDLQQNQRGDLEYVVVRNRITGQLLDRYSLQFPNEQQYNNYLQSISYRRNQPNIVRVIHFQPKVVKQFCGSSYMLNIYLQHCRSRLSQYEDIPFPDYLYCAMAMLEGYKKLFSKVGRFGVYQSQVMIDDEGQVRVWLNSDFSQNEAQLLRIQHIQQPTNSKNQEYQIVNDIMNIIFDNSDESDGPPIRLVDYYERQMNNLNGKVSFEDAKGIILDYARQNRIQVPDIFKSVYQIYRARDPNNRNEISRNQNINLQNISNPTLHQARVPMINTVATRQFQQLNSGITSNSNRDLMQPLHSQASQRNVQLPVASRFYPPPAPPIHITQQSRSISHHPLPILQGSTSSLSPRVVPTQYSVPSQPQHIHYQPVNYPQQIIIPGQQQIHQQVNKPLAISAPVHVPLNTSQPAYYNQFNQQIYPFFGRPQPFLQPQPQPQHQHQQQFQHFQQIHQPQQIQQIQRPMNFQINQQVPQGFIGQTLQNQSSDIIRKNSVPEPTHFNPEPKNVTKIQERNQMKELNEHKYLDREQQQIQRDLIFKQQRSDQSGLKNQIEQINEAKIINDLKQLHRIQEEEKSRRDRNHGPSAHDQQHQAFSDDEGQDEDEGEEDQDQDQDEDGDGFKGNYEYNGHFDEEKMGTEAINYLQQKRNSGSEKNQYKYQEKQESSKNETNKQNGYQQMEGHSNRQVRPQISQPQYYSGFNPHSPQNPFNSLQFGQPISNPSTQANVIKNQIKNMNAGDGEIKSTGPSTNINKMGLNIDSKNDERKASYYTLSKQVELDPEIAADLFLYGGL